MSTQESPSGVTIKDSLSTLASPAYNTLFEYAAAILATNDTVGKAKLSFEAYDLYKAGRLPLGDQDTAPIPSDYPARPTNLTTVGQANVQSKVKNDHKANVIRLVHSQAHIESYAIDLAWDILLRFARPEPYPSSSSSSSSSASSISSADAPPAPEQAATSNEGAEKLMNAADTSTDSKGDADTETKTSSSPTFPAVEGDKPWTMHLLPGEKLPKEYFECWLQVAVEEARHFSTWNTRLGELGAHYGALPVHDGLWQSALATRRDLLGRLAIVHCVHEAHGLDCGNRLVKTLVSSGDKTSAALLSQIQFEEIGHVAAGVTWFKYICKVRGWENETELRFHQVVKAFHKGNIRPPFAKEERAAAGMTEGWYVPIATMPVAPPPAAANTAAAAAAEPADAATTAASTSTAADEGAVAATATSVDASSSSCSSSSSSSSSSNTSTSTPTAATSTSSSDASSETPSVS